MKAGAAQAGKTERDENFPVASRLIAPHLRPPILAFYRFARKADDIANSRIFRRRPSSTRSTRSMRRSPARATPMPTPGLCARCWRRGN